MVPPRFHGTAGGTTAWFYARRATSRSKRVMSMANVPFRRFDAARPHLEDIPTSRMDLLGPIVRQHIPVIPDQSRANFMAAFDKRCNYHTDERCDDSLWEASKKLLDDFCPFVHSQVDWTLERFHSWNSQFPPDKQKRHLKVLPYIMECTDKQFSAKQIFVKVEALLKRHDPNWAPRIIYQSSDIHNALLGPIMQECTQRMFAAMAASRRLCGVGYVGGYKSTPHNLVEQIELGQQSTSVYIESDFSSNDMKQVEDVHLIEIMWLLRLGAPRWLTGLMMCGNVIRVSSYKHGVRAVIRNQLPSGSQSTTFRNTIWNMTINFCFCQRVGARGVVLVLGDDMTMRLDNPFSTRNKNIRREYQHVAKLARMDAKVKVFRKLADCVFLSRNFVPTAEGHVMVPLLGKAVCRFNVKATSNPAISDQAYLAGKALSYAYEFRYVPDLARLFYGKYLELSADGPVGLEGFGWFAKGAFLRYGVDGVAKRVFAPERQCKRDELTQFYEPRAGLFGSEVLALFSAVLYGTEDIDEMRLVGLVRDFM